MRTCKAVAYSLLVTTTTRTIQTVFTDDYILLFIFTKLFCHILPLSAALRLQSFKMIAPAITRDTLFPNQCADQPMSIQTKEFLIGLRAFFTNLTTIILVIIFIHFLYFPNTISAPRKPLTKLFQSIGFLPAG